MAARPSSLTDTPGPARRRIAHAIAAATVFAAGLVAAVAFSSGPAAAADCVPLPLLPCVTTTVATTVPSLPLPTTTVEATTPSLPLPTTTTTSNAQTTTSTTGSAATPTSPAATAPAPTTAAPRNTLSVKLSARVRGHGARRVVELRLRLSGPARVTALLTRGKAIVGRATFSARTGSNVRTVRVAPGATSGAAAVALGARSATGQVTRASYRFRLPR